MISVQTDISPSASPLLGDLDLLIASRKKMTSRLYQIILAGEASLELLQQFVIHRYPIKNLWTRNILGIAARLDDYELRSELVKNIYEEETGELTNTKRHLELFIDFGISLGLKRSEIVDSINWLPETEAVIQHNLWACNRNDVHFTIGVASVLLLMEGQPPIISNHGLSMEAVMRDIYRLPAYGYEYFSHHASLTSGHSVSDIEDDHASTARQILAKYCIGFDLQVMAKNALKQAIELRHRHFNAILEKFYNLEAPPFRWQEVIDG